MKIYLYFLLRDYEFTFFIPFSYLIQVGVHCGIFHGGKSLCEAQKTTEKEVAKDGSAEWEKDIQFDVAVSNIPRMARLCIVVYELSKTKGVKAKKLRDSKQVNSPLFHVLFFKLSLQYLSLFLQRLM